MKDRYKHQRKTWLKNHTVILHTMKAHSNWVKVSKIQAEAKNKTGVSLTLRTIYTHLNKMRSTGDVRKKGLRYIYAPYDVLLTRWQERLDSLFQALMEKGYDVEWVLNTQAIIFTPRNAGIGPVQREDLHTLVDDMANNPSAPLIVLGRAAGTIEKGAAVKFLPRNQKKEEN